MRKQLHYTFCKQLQKKSFSAKGYFSTVLRPKGVKTPSKSNSAAADSFSWLLFGQEDLELPCV